MVIAFFWVLIFVPIAIVLATQASAPLAAATGHSSRWIWSALFAAQCLPVGPLATYFHRDTSLGVAVGLVMLPLMSLLMMYGLVSA